MNIVIRPLNEGGFGSAQTRIVERITGDPRTDALIDELRRAPSADRPALARRIAQRLGEASAEYPLAVPARVWPTLDRIGELVGDPDEAFVETLHEIVEEAERRRSAEIDERALSIAVADLATKVKERGVGGLSDMTFCDAAENLVMACDASPSIIVEKLAATAAAPLDAKELARMHRAAEIGRRSRHRSLWGSYESIAAELDDRLASGQPLFESYEIDVLAWSPNPYQYEDELAEAEAARRAEADEQAVRCAEAEIRNTRPTITDLLAVARSTARQTLASPIGVLGLVNRLSAAQGGLNRVDTFALEVSIEAARERRDLPYDDDAAAARVAAIVESRFGSKVIDPGGAEAPSGTPADTTTRAPVEPRVAPSPTAPAPAEASTPTKHATNPACTAAAREAEMEALTHVPGLVGELVDWITAASMKPNRTLAFAAVLPLVGTLAGRLYETETTLRTNIYTLGLAPSGFGKDHARSCVNILVERAGCGAWLAGSKLSSGTGMRRRVEDHPAIMWTVDEFGGFMRQIGDTRNAHNHQIRDLILEYFETAGDVFRGADYAGEQGRPVFSPNVSLHGLSTPTDFWGACQSLSAEDGFLARFLAFSVGNKRQPSVKATLKKNDPPVGLIEGLRSLTRSRVGGNLNGRLADGSTSVKALTVPFADGAEEVFYDAKDRLDGRAFAKSGRAEGSIYARVVEHALKIAMIIAIGIDADKPVITVERFEHGLRVAEHCAETTLREIKGRLADNDRQREHVDVLRWIKEAGWAGIGRTALLKRVNGRFAERRVNEILQTLVDGSKEVASAQRATKGRPAMRFIAVENLEADDGED